MERKIRSDAFGRNRLKTRFPTWVVRTAPPIAFVNYKRALTVAPAETDAPGRCRGSNNCTTSPVSVTVLVLGGRCTGVTSPHIAER